MRAAFGILVATGLVLVGCGASNNGATPLSTPTVPASGSPSPTDAAGTTSSGSTTSAIPKPTTSIEYASAYLMLVAPLNAAGVAFGTAMPTSTSTTTAQLVASAVPYVAAIRQFDAGVQRVTWPSTVETEVRAVVRLDAAYIGALQATAPAPSAWVNNVVTAGNASSAGSGKLRASLGLPAAVG